MTQDKKKSVEFDELEEGERYSSTTTELQVFEVVRKEEDRVIYDRVRDDFNDVGTFTRERWNPDQWQPVGGTIDYGFIKVRDV